MNSRRLWITRTDNGTAVEPLRPRTEISAIIQSLWSKNGCFIAVLKYCVRGHHRRCQLDAMLDVHQRRKLSQL